MLKNLHNPQAELSTTVTLVGGLAEITILDKHIASTKEIKTFILFILLFY
jgi:hypothetical protein